MESYIKSLIEIMKSEKEISINKKQVNLQNFIDYITEAAYSMTMDKGIKFIKQVGKIPQFISADEAALQRALINIISNAVDYTPSSGEILFQVDTNSDYITFVVEDSGKGFTQEELKHASEQFFQGDKSRTSKDHYGMGLYIAKEFLKQHNGNLYLENSKKTGGARVILDIPISL
jgi:signal transduction histidine kinase